MRFRRIGIGAVGLALAATLLAACSQTPLADDSFMEKIPTALESSDLGITEAWADKGVDGLTTHLSVGATFDRAEITASDLQQLIAIVVDQNTISVRWLQLAVEDPDGEDIDIVPLLTELGATPATGTFVRVPYDEAESIAKESAE